MQPTIIPEKMKKVLCAMSDAPCVTCGGLSVPVQFSTSEHVQHVDIKQQ